MNRFPDHKSVFKRNIGDYIDNTYFSAGNALRGDDRIVVYVEGYDDIAFWRNIFDKVEGRKFKIMTPVRSDLAKGKKVVLSFASRVGDKLLLCVDSDFDYLMAGGSDSSRLVNSCSHLIQTYAYAIENLQCDPRSLQSVAVRVSNSDEELFDFVSFFERYSEIIYPLFLWYYWSAASGRVDVYPLSDFRESVRINFLELDQDGAKTLEWLRRKVDKNLSQLERRNGAFVDRVAKCDQYLQDMGVSAQKTHFYMQGHTFKDDVVKPVLSRVCERLRGVMQTQIESSSAKSISKRNQLSGYNNSLVDIDFLLRENLGYMRYEFYDRIRGRIDEVLSGIGSSQ